MFRSKSGLGTLQVLAHMVDTSIELGTGTAAAMGFVALRSWCRPQ